MKFSQHLRTLALLFASVVAGSAFAAAPTVVLVSQEVWTGPELVVTGPALSRAEVHADLQLWQQAGLDAYNQGEGGIDDQQAYEAKLANYQQQRNSTVFVDLVRRIQTGQ